MLKDYNERRNKKFKENSSPKILVYKILLSYCLKCRKNTESKNPKVAKTKNGRIILLSICAVCDRKKSTFIKDREASGLLSSLGIKAP